MKETIYFFRFRDVFKASRPNNFSDQGLRVLFEYLQDYEEETGEEIEFDPIALCCDFNEMTLEEINQCYQEEFEHLDHAADWLQDQTSVCGQTDSTIVFQAF